MIIWGKYNTKTDKNVHKCMYVCKLMYIKRAQTIFFRNIQNGHENH